MGTATLELKPIPGGDQPTTEAPTKPAIDKIVEAAIAAKTPIDKLTALYLKLRNGEADLKKQAAEKVGPIKTGMELLENHFLAQMLELGVDSLKNAAGTPYKSNKVSITVADNEAWLNFVLDRALSALPIKPEMLTKIKEAMLESGQLALIEARASKTAVEALLEETKILPDGLNRREETTVNVRAS